MKKRATLKTQLAEKGNKGSKCNKNQIICYLFEILIRFQLHLDPKVLKWRSDIN